MCVYSVRFYLCSSQDGKLTADEFEINHFFAKTSALCDIEVEPKREGTLRDAY